MSDELGGAVIDAALETPAVDTATVDSTVDTTTTNEPSVIDATSETEESAEGSETETHNADGTEKTPEEQAAFKTAAAAKSTESASILEQRAALKTLRDMDPKYAGVVKALHSSAERWSAAAPLLGTGEGGGINGLKSLLDAAGVKSLPELSRAYIEQNQNWESVKQADQMLYSASKELAKNVWDDLKTNVGDKAPEIFGKNVANLVEALRTNPETRNAYYNEVSKPNLHASLMESKFPTVLNALHEALQAGDGKTAGAVLNNIITWWNGIDEDLSETGKINAERERWSAERAEAEGKSKTADTEKWENSTAETADKTNNSLLSKSLAPFLKLPFFSGYGKENLMPLGNLIKANLYAALKADKVYQTHISSMWKAGNNSSNNAKIQEYHESTVKSLADRVVRESVQKLYPGAFKGGMAAGRAAAAADKKTAAAKAGAASVATSRPIYVASKPSNLQRADVTIGGRQFTTNDLQVLEISGKGYVRSGDGRSWRYISWRK